jgi:hypothetical protein
LDPCARTSDKKTQGGSTEIGRAMGKESGPGHATMAAALPVTNSKPESRIEKPVTGPTLRIELRTNRSQERVFLKSEENLNQDNHASSRTIKQLNLATR